MLRFTAADGTEWSSALPRSPPLAALSRASPARPTVKADVCAVGQSNSGLSAAAGAAAIDQRIAVAAFRE
jgi:hypothetical protein